MKGWKKAVIGAVVVGGLGVAYVLTKAHAAAPATLFAQFRKLGDVNADGVIDGTDLALIQVAYGSTPESPNWNPAADLNGDGVVNILDVVTCSSNQGLTYATWLKTQGYAKQIAQPRTNEERAKAHFNISDEEWNKLTEEQKQGLISMLPPRGSAQNYTVQTTNVPIKEI